MAGPTRQVANNPPMVPAAIVGKTDGIGRKTDGRGRDNGAAAPHTRQDRHFGIRFKRHRTRGPVRLQRCVNRHRVAGAAGYAHLSGGSGNIGARRGAGSTVRQTTELTRVKARIKALADKTVSNGCTEAEAIAAAEMVGRLLERYALSMAHIDVREERCVQVEVPIGGKQRRPIDGCVTAIARFCDCEVWVSRDSATPAMCSSASRPIRRWPARSLASPVSCSGRWQNDTDRY